MMIPTPKAVMENDATPAAVLSFAEAQSHLRIDGTTDQVLVESIVKAVTKRVEDIISRKLITQVWSIYYDFFPTQYKKDDWWEGTKDGAVSELFSPVRFLELPFGPCQSAYFLKTFDETDTGTAMDASLYSIDLVSARPRIALKTGATWPTTVLRPVNGIQVKATFGYGTASSAVPEDIRHAIRISTAKLYENRGDSPEGEFFGFSGFTLPNTAQMLLEAYKQWRL